MLPQAQAWAQQNPTEAGYVIKPRHNMGARGVLFLKDPSFLEMGLEYALRYASTPKGVVLEHYIPAEEISVDALVWKNQVCLTGVADRIIEKYRGLFFIERGHVMPAQTHLLEKTKLSLQLLQKITRALSQAMGQPFTGCLKGDFRFVASQQKLYLGEVAGRLSGGFMSTHTFPLSTGESLMQAYIELACGQKPKLFSKKIHYHKIAAEFSMAVEPGALKTLSFPAHTPKAIKDIFVMKHPPELVFDLKNNLGKLLHTIYVADAYHSILKTKQKWHASLHYEINPFPFHKTEIRRLAKKNFNPKACWVCRICDGTNCASGVPGMGGAGSMQTFQDNFLFLTKYKIKNCYLQTQTPAPNTSTVLLGQKWAAPILCAPITGAKTNMGSSTTELEYALDIALGMQAAQLLPTFGDGASPLKYKVGLLGLQQRGGGIPIFKPRASQDELLRRIQEAQAAGALAWGMDVDGLGFVTMQRKGQTTRRYSVAELRSLKESSSLPMLLKGIMSVEDALRATEAGADVLVVSNHGGRVLDRMPATVQVLPKIYQVFQEKKITTPLWVDGGIRSGQDVFIMLALGAQAVLVGRPVTIAAMAAGSLGVASYMHAMIEELKQTMYLTGCSSLKEIGPQHIEFFS